MGCLGGPAPEPAAVAAGRTRASCTTRRLRAKLSSTTIRSVLASETVDRADVALLDDQLATWDLGPGFRRLYAEYARATNVGVFERATAHYGGLGTGHQLDQ